MRLGRLVDCSTAKKKERLIEVTHFLSTTDLLRFGLLQLDLSLPKLYVPTPPWDVQEVFKATNSIFQHVKFTSNI